ncbi:MAG: 2'-5' RNA ligase family protein [Clostridium sp.]
MVKRCIMIFPKFENVGVINRVRDKFDPLASHVAPHVTLVFPFESDIEAGELRSHLEQVLSEFSPFKLILSGITPVVSHGNYLFLGLKEGQDVIKKIHSSLYTGILKEFFPPWLEDGSYLPHMTVGMINNTEDYEKAIFETRDINDVFETVVERISVEIIDENEDSIIEMHVKLT